MKKEILVSLVVCSFVTGLQAGGDIGGVVSFENPDANIVIPQPEYIPEPEYIPAPTPAPIAVPAPTPAPVVVSVPTPKPVVVKKPEPKTPSNLYTVVKGIYTMGDTNDCKCTDDGLGAGLDIGYKLGNGLAAELGFGYTKNDFENTSGDVNHKRGSLSLVYTYEVLKNLGVFGKMGYMIEKSSLSGADNESGLVYGGGLEYGLGGKYSIIGEIEASTIDSLRGEAASLGLKYTF